jgi:DNA-binding XRE family transcriptional regulator
MDKRRTRIDREQESALRDAFDRDIRDQMLSIAEAVKAMRRLSRLTQPEFARHRGISLDTLKQIEAGRSDPKVSTLNKIAEIFGLELKFVEKK